MIVGMSGYAYSGKDTVGNYLVEKYGFTRLAFATALKDMAYTLNPIVANFHGTNIRLSEFVNKQGWDEAKKHQEVRRILQVLGTECGRDIVGPNVWVDILERKIKESPVKDIVITDVRFENEVNFVKSHGYLWHIDRKNVGALNSHSSEHSVDPTFADVIFRNHWDLKALYKQVDTVMEIINA